MEPTIRLYWEDDHCFECTARLTGKRDGLVAFDRTCFYPGGGGQPADRGDLEFEGSPPIAVPAVEADVEGVIWHCLGDGNPGIEIGHRARLRVDQKRRLALTRSHTALHVLNTIAWRDYDAWITGVQIGADYSRIDFKWEGFSPGVCPEVESKVNGVLSEGRSLRASFVSEREFQRRPELLRTWEARPPAIAGKVRVVEIEGFDAQACGGTHAASTLEVGKFSITKAENKGRLNKRLYVRLGSP